SLADDDVCLKYLILALQPGGEVDTVADGRKIELLARPDVAEDYLRGVESDAYIKWRKTVDFPVAIKLPELFDHLEGGAGGQHGVRTVRCEGAAVRHDAIANELVHDAVVLEDDIGHSFQILVELLEQAHGIGFLGKGRKTSHVGEEDRQFASFSVESEGVQVVEHISDKLRRD